ncbi:MAG: glycerol-3-phosphate acyltransferase PlsX [Oceanicoccus sp.]|jgi:glycerol-3-phosphate acyltransferase PlsX
MAERIRIAIDCMSGDLGLRASLPAAQQALTLLPNVELTLVGNKAEIQTALPSSLASSFTIVHAPDIVTMTDKPSHALRRKPKSSMRVAINLLQQGEVDGVVSAGNTGALMAMSCFVLKTLPGIDRPAICSAFPTANNGHSFVLDLGANVDSCAEHLHQFAIMGAALCSAVDGKQSPAVALLNIGEEALKGNEQVKLAAQLLEQDSDINYSGYVEGDGLFAGNADVIVADGFVGNVALKASEGTARYIANVAASQFNASFISRCLAFFAFPVLKRIYRKLDPQQYNGASLLGLNGVVVKSHGSASVDGFVYAIAQAHSEVHADLLSIIKQRLLHLSN